MVGLRRNAAALVAVLALGIPAGALAQDPTPEPLTEGPPTPLSGDATPTPTPTAAPTATPAPKRDGTSDLPNTGAEAALTALLGLGLLAGGGGLRATLATGDGRD
jgi:LPXTG-motif cell wall-anchored protein